MLDARALTEAQHERARELLDRFRNRLFLPANEAYRDETRQALDAAVLVELLGPADIDSRTARRAPHAVVRRADRARRQGDAADVATLRAGLARPRSDRSRIRPFVQKTVAMAAEGDFDKALALATRLEDEEVVRKQTLRG